MPVFGGELPIGAGLMWYSNTAPSSFLICDGTSLSRTAYAKLFAIIGTTYGTADAASFNLPDLRQRFPLGKAAAGTGNTLAGTGGVIDHTHTSAAHTHTVPSHYHGMGAGATLNITTATMNSGAMSANSTHTHTDSGHTHAIWRSIDLPGGGTNRRGVADTNTNALANMNSGFANLSTEDLSHTHSISHTHAAGNFAGLIGLVTGGVDGNAAMTSGSTTPSATGTNNPPYVVVNYIIKYQ